jgi:hypothetical protein
MIKDLSVSKELDRKAMSTVRGGNSDQANGVSQANIQVMAAAANVGNGLVAGGPITVQSDNHFKQDASNYSYQDNFKSLGIGVPFLRVFG